MESSISNPLVLVYGADKDEHGEIWVRQSEAWRWE